MFKDRTQFDAALQDLPAPNGEWRAQALARQQKLTKPPGSLGRLEDVAVFLAGWRATPRPRAEKITVALFAGNHGVTKRGVSPYPASVTAQMVENFNSGGAAINAIAASGALEFFVTPLELDRPTADIAIEPALSEGETLSAMRSGAEAVGDDIDCLAIGEMGIGNTTIAAALAAQAMGGCGSDWVGPGTGHDEPGVALKARTVDDALKLHSGAAGDAFETLRRLGGRETAAIAGAVLAARHKRIPVLLDGYVVCASVAPLFSQNPDILAHCLAGHLSAEPAHSRLLQAFGLEPLLQLGMRLGEGTGAALAAQVVRAAVATHNSMATFSEAGVSDRDDG